MSNKMDKPLTMSFLNEPNKATVLIVDDAPYNVQALAILLKDDYKIMVATDGARCIELATGDNPPDLILLDIEMPDINGYEVCRRLKSLEFTKHIPIIFITGKDGTSDEEFGFNLGAVDYITKPVQPSIVKVRVKTQITIKQQNDLLKRMALYDQLTNLYNRHYLMELFPKRISESLRHAQALSLIMVDIDHFKEVNDNHGHDVGDLVLQAISKEISSNLRSEDIAARFGGEEFIVILSQCKNQ
jgi:PleD family two-component response regulator